MDKAQLTALLDNADLEMGWDSCLEGWSDATEEQRALARSTITAKRDECLSIAEDIDDANELGVVVSLFYIQLKSTWSFLNTQIQYQTVATGTPDLALMFRAALLTSLIEVLENIIPFRDIDRITTFIAKPLESSEDQLPITVAADDFARILEQTGEAMALQSSLDGHLTLLGTICRDQAPQASQQLAATYQEFKRVNTRLQNDIIGLRMVRAQVLFDRLEAFVEKVSGRTGRKVMLRCTGGEETLDHQIGDALIQPLLLFLEEAVYRIEPPRDRQSAGKPKKGALNLSCIYQGNHIRLDITDDGRPLELTHALESEGHAPVSEGYAPVSERYAPVSGGGEKHLAALRQSFQELDNIQLAAKEDQLLRALVRVGRFDGIVSIEAAHNGLNRLTCLLPQPLALMEFLLVRVQCQPMAIPLYAVRELLHRPKSQLLSMQGSPMLDLRGKWIPIISLATLLCRTDGDDGPEVYAPPEHDTLISLVVLEISGYTVAVEVSQFLYKMKTVLRPLGRILGAPFYVAGIILDQAGDVVIVLDPMHLERAHKK